MAVVSGSIDRVVFHNPDNGYCIARFRLLDEKAPAGGVTTIVGTLPAPQPGEILRVTGEWQMHPVHGRHFRVERFEPELPDTAEGIERYLGSGAIRGVGPVTARRIVDCFGEATLKVIEEDPDLLTRVAGISEKRREVIARSWQEQQRVRELAMFLQEHEISVALAARIHAAYGEDAMEIIQRDPYQLAHDIHGIGFKTADAVARRLGMSKCSLSRYVAGLKYALSQATDDGHVFLPRGDLLDRAARLLQAPGEELEPALLELLRRGDAVVDGVDVYLTPFYKAEVGVARMLREANTTPSVLTLDRRFDPARAIERAGAEQGLALAPKQLQAAQQALERKVSILTGGPGTGKTSTLRTIIRALETAEISFCLCAPTGRAAKKVAETTGRRARTIHRLLEYQPGVNLFNFDQNRPLPYDFVIVDEVSMLDTLLFYHLLKAIPRESHLLLVGDADQLPAVGPGNVLSDLIRSDQIPAVTLTELFRQARNSQIVLAAHSINHGEVPRITNGASDDLFFFRQEREERVVDVIKELLAERVPRRFGLDPAQDIQIISPMHNGPAGVTNLNNEIQGLLNPSRRGVAEIQRVGRIVRVGDKVMQIRNNYDKDVYNGDLGTVASIEPDEQKVVVSYASGMSSVDVDYEFRDLDELVLAYAISVHKAQGSEFPCVVMPLVTRHYMLLQRNLVYTALTRAKRLCVLVGNPRALSIAALADRGQRRNTRLRGRLTPNQSDAAALQLDLA